MTKTQMHYARRGELTKQMSYVAKVEGIGENLVMDEVAKGSIIIPANVNHINLKPMGIGRKLKTKVNANIGNSSLSSDICAELRKLEICLEFGADTVMDLSTDGDLDAIRSAIIEHSSVPVGTVPMYEILKEAKEVTNITNELILSVLEKQAKQGVSYFTIHAGFLREFLPLVKKRKMGIVSRGGSLSASYMSKLNRQNPFYEIFVLIDDNMVFDIDNLKGFLNDTSSFGFIAKENNKIIGFAYCYTLLRPDGKTMFYLHSIGMLPNYQDKGYGSKLLSFIKEYSKEIGCSEMFLITDKGNPRACHVYEKLGGKNDYKDEIVYVYDYEKGDK